MNTNLMMQVATMSTSVEEAVNNVNLCQHILDVLTSTGERMRATEIAQKGDITVCGYPKTQQVSHWLRVLVNLGMVKREEIGTEVVMIGGHWACNGNPREEGSWYLTEQISKEVPIAFFSLS